MRLKRTWSRETRLERTDKGLESDRAAAQRQIREDGRLSGASLAGGEGEAACS